MIQMGNTRPLFLLPEISIPRDPRHGGRGVSGVELNSPPLAMAAAAVAVIVSTRLFSERRKVRADGKGQRNPCVANSTTYHPTDLSIEDAMPKDGASMT
jgi:hypothetical protein